MDSALGGHTAPAEQPLAGGAANAGKVVRVGDTVRRPVPRFPEFERLLLAHLERVGFTGAPRHLGLDDQGREVLTYIDGVVPLPPFPAWSRTQEVADSVARLLRDYHDAVRGFVWPASVGHSDLVLSRWSGGDLVCHNDVVRTNVVFRDGRAVALIDFELAAPAAPEWEIGCAAQQWIPLRGEEDPDPAVAGPRTARRLRRFCDVYGLAPERRPAVLDVILASEAAGYERLMRLVDDGHPAYVAMWNGGAAERIEQRRVWLARHHDLLREALW